MPKKETGEATANERVEQAVEEIMKLSENTGNEITLAEIGEHLSKIKLNKDQIDEVYDLVEKNGISIVDTREPNGNELDDVEDEDENRRESSQSAWNRETKMLRKSSASPISVWSSALLRDTSIEV